MKMPIPKYYVTKVLLHARLQREYAVGARLPSEHQLCRDFRVSRMTIQQAMTLLEKDGVIRREQGRGTFYLGEAANRTELQLSGLLESAMNYRGNALARVLRKETIQATDRVADRLRVAPGSPVVAVEGVADVDREPIMFIVAYLPPDLGTQILAEEVDLTTRTIISFLSERYGVRVGSAVQAIGAALADPAFAGHLGVEVGSPVLEVERTFFGADGRPVNFSIAFYRADRYRFQVAIKDWESPAPWS